MTSTLGCRRRSGRSARRRPPPLGPVWLALCLTIAAAGPALAETPALAAGENDPRLELGMPSVRDGQVWLQVSVARLLQGEAMDALHAGLPATVVFEWTIWQRRPGWWDRDIGGGPTVYRIFYDVLQNRYNVFDHRGRPIAFLDNLPEIERSISDLPGLRLIAATELSAGRTYYVEVRASVELLSDEEVSRLNEWLTGSDRENKRFDVVGYLSGRLSRALDDMVGPANKSVVARTADFAGFTR